MDRTAWKKECARLAKSYEARIEAANIRVAHTREIALFSQIAADRAAALVKRLEAERVRT